MVYDCFLFFNELDLLDVRMHELNNVVDFFVLQESTKTHSGKPKPLYFQENKERFKEFLPKIIHRVIEDTPDDFENLQEKDNDYWYNVVINRLKNAHWWDHKVSSWGRDAFEKESLIRSLANCNDNDIIILSDLDEIPKNEIINQLKSQIITKNIFRLINDMYFYFLNLKTDERWFGSILMNYETFKKTSFTELRANKQGLQIEDSGWHFTYLGNRDSIIKKLESFSHQELNLEWVKQNLDYMLENAISINKDLFDRPTNFSLDSLDSLPKYIRDNQKKYEKYLKL